MNRLLHVYSFLIGVVITGAIIFALYSTVPKPKNPYEFTWPRPGTYVLADLSKSATCNFSKNVSTIFYQDFNKGENASNIHYAVSNDDGTDPITFLDLDTSQPRVRTNTGEATLTVINDNSISITLTSVPSGLSGAPTGDMVIYRLFKQDGVLVYADTHFDFALGPVGTLEMGYCH